MKTKTFLLVLFIFINLENTFSQPAIEWQKSFGGTDIDSPHSIQQTADGGYIIAGYTQSNDGDVTGHHGNVDCWVIKLNSTGTIQWQKSLGGTNDEQAMSIQQTTDGGYIIAGFTASHDGDVTGIHSIYTDYWIVKINSTGIIQWQKCLGGTDIDNGWSAQQSNDGGYIVIGDSRSNNGDVTGHHGTSTSDYWVVKLNDTGTIQWQKSLGGSAGEVPHAVKQTTDGGYIIAGNALSNDGDVTGNHGDYDYWIVKLNNLGVLQWQKCLGGSLNEEAHSIQQTTDMGYIIAGWSGSNDGDVIGHHGTNNDDFWIVKLDSSGGVQWKKCLGGSANDNAYSIQQTVDGGYICAGSSESDDGDLNLNRGNRDLWIVKLASSGAIEWQKSMGGTNYDYTHSIQQTTDGGFIVEGTSRSNDGDVTGNHGDYDYWIVKLSKPIGIDEFDEDENNLIISPNPLISSSILQLNVEVKDAEVIIYNLFGQEIMKNKLSGHNMEIKKGNLENGVYFVRVHDGIRQYMQKIIVQ